MLHVAVVQAEPVPRMAEALDKTRTLTLEAARGGAALVAFPETWIPGYPAWLDVCRDVALWDHAPVKRVYAAMAAESVDVNGDGGRALGAIAREAGVTLVLGVTERVAQGPGSRTLYNSLLTYGPDGTLLNHHRKLVPTYTERLVWGTGDADGLHAVDTPAGRVGGLVCWEHWMPLARQALHDSAEDVHVAVWPAVREMHLVASRHYAFEGRCYVLAAGALLSAAMLPIELEVDRTALPGDERFVLRGGSAIIAPDGRILAGPVYDEACILRAELDLSRIREESMTLDVAGHYGRRDCFHFEVHRER